MKNKKTISIFVSHQGCPNDCVFCNQRRITGIKNEREPQEIIEHIEKSLQTIEADYVEIAFFGGSFTAIEEEKQNTLLQIAKSYMEQGKVSGIRISTRPDAINQAILCRLKEYGVHIIELGVQSLDEEVLAASNRGHDASCVYESAELILKNGFKLGLQMMLGLPQDNEEKIQFTISEFIKIKPDFVRIYPVLVIKDTELESLFKNKQYEPLSLEKAVALSKNAYVQFREHHIDVIRIGLQATDTMNMDVVAGPYHAAFGEMVYSLLFRDIMEENIRQSSQEIILYAHKKHISKLIGNRKSNLRYFKEKYDVTIRVREWDEEDEIMMDEQRIAIKKYF